MSYTKTLRESFPQFDPDTEPGDAVALRVDVSSAEEEQPVHKHRRGQIVLALRGTVTCRISDALMMVLPQSGVWIPGDMPHSNHASPDAQIIFLFVNPEAVDLPDRPCILNISPLVREMVVHLADSSDTFPDAESTRQFCEVMFGQLARMPVEYLSVPLLSHPKLRLVCNALIDNPADRRSRADWAKLTAMSERTFDRLVIKETGQPFGRWRQQLQLIVAIRELSAGVSVQQVALALGYESTTAFIVMFKKAYGVSPGHYIGRHTDRHLTMAFPDRPASS